MRQSKPGRIFRIADDSARAAASAVEALRNGEILGFPTETVYGLGVRFGDAAALERLRVLKGRDRDKPFQILIADAGDAEKLGAQFSPTAAALGARFWPGALTLIVPDGCGGTLGLRLPDAPFVRTLIQTLGTALVATSANRGGEPPAKSAADAAKTLGEEVALYLDGEGGGGVSSTVVRVTGRELDILRAGAIPEAELRACVEESAPDNTNGGQRRRPAS